MVEIVDVGGPNASSFTTKSPSFLTISKITAQLAYHWHILLTFPILKEKLSHVGMDIQVNHIILVTDYRQKVVMVLAMFHTHH